MAELLSREGQLLPPMLEMKAAHRLDPAERTARLEQQPCRRTTSNLAISAQIPFPIGKVGPRSASPGAADSPGKTVTRTQAHGEEIIPIRRGSAGGPAPQIALDIYAGLRRARDALLGFLSVPSGTWGHCLFPLDNVDREPGPQAGSADRAEGPGGRRGDKGRTSWERVYRLAEPWLPLPRIQHPYPEQRLAVMTQGRSAVR